MLLCLEVATKLVVGYQLGYTYCRCYFVLSGKMYSPKEVVVVDSTVMRALGPRARIPADGGVLLLVVALPEVLFLVRFVAAWSELFSPSPLFWPVVPA
jgi:hypothetical protein